jgi:hypothetical protein
MELNAANSAARRPLTVVMEASLVEPETLSWSVNVEWSKMLS